MLMLLLLKVGTASLGSVILDDPNPQRCNHGAQELMHHASEQFGRHLPASPPCVT